MKFAVDDLYYKYHFCATSFKYGNESLSVIWIQLWILDDNRSKILVSFSWYIGVKVFGCFGWVMYKPLCKISENRQIKVLTNKYDHEMAHVCY